MQVVLFDIDGTLVSCGGAGRAALHAGLTEEFGALPLPAELILSGRTDRAIGLDLLRRCGLADTRENLDRLAAAYLRALPALMGRMEAARVLPGVGELLRRLAGRRGVCVGLLTGNMRAGARIKLGHFGLFDCFAFGGFGDAHEDRDDVAREALAEARRHAGREVRPSDVWVVGDTPLDVRCARAIGANALAVATGSHPRDELTACEPDLLLDNLSDVTALPAW